MQDGVNENDDMMQEQQDQEEQIEVQDSGSIVTNHSDILVNFGHVQQ